MVGGRDAINQLSNLSVSRPTARVLTMISCLDVLLPPHLNHRHACWAPGAIRNVMYAAAGRGPPAVQDPVASAGLRFSELNPCLAQDPCHHGGHCLPTDLGAACDCRGLDFEGDFCQTGKSPIIVCKESGLRIVEDSRSSNLLPNLYLEARSLKTSSSVRQFFNSRTIGSAAALI